VPVEARKEKIRFREAGGRCKRVGQDEVDGAGALRSVNRGGALGGRDDGSGSIPSGWRLRDDVVVVIERFAYATKTVVGEEVKQAIFEDGSANRATELLLLVNGLRQKKGRRARVRGVESRVPPGQRVKSIEGGIAKVIEEVAVDGVGSGPRDRVDLSADVLSELRSSWRSRPGTP